MKIKDLLNLDNDSLPVRLLIQSGYKIIMKVPIKSKVIQPETCKKYYQCAEQKTEGWFEKRSWWTIDFIMPKIHQTSN